MVPLFEAAAKRDGIALNLRPGANERLYLEYNPVHEPTSSYVKPAVMLEFGARSTGEPVVEQMVKCDAAEIVSDVALPSANVRAMKVGRTFWEKATAAHVYCVQGSLKGDRFSRHWHDLYYIAGSSYFEESVEDLDLAKKVAVHKSMFFAERDRDHNWVDYNNAVANISLIPSGDALDSLESDYARMRESGMIPPD